MKLLYLTPRLPFPPLRGDQLVAFHRLRILGRRHEITLVSFSAVEPEPHVLDELRPHVARLEVVHLPVARSVGNVALRAALTSLPLQVLYYGSREFERRLAAVVREERFDLVHAYFHRMAPYLDDVAPPRVLDVMDSLELRLTRQAKNAAGPVRWLLREELRRMRRYERGIHDLAEALIVVSGQDAPFFPSDKVTIVENGVDTDVFSPLEGVARPSHIVFSGRMGYAPNAEAAQWFVRECLPRVRTRVPGATLSIVGADPPRSVQRLARHSGVTVTGFVDSIARALNEASVVVVPLQSGSGIQNKILEAMACARPIVTTTIGRGAIQAVDGRDLVVADGPAAFADAVVALLDDRQRAESLGLRGRAYVVENHSWERAAHLVESVYARLAAPAPQ